VTNLVFTADELIAALADSLTSHDALCPCHGFRLIFLAYLRGEIGPYVTVDAPRCELCDALADAVMRSIQRDPFASFELASWCTKINLIDHTLPEALQ
jgi:hypothetical protein